MKKRHELRKTATPIIASVFVSIIYLVFSIPNAWSASFRFAVTADVKGMFPEILETLEYLSYKHSVEIKLYKKDSGPRAFVIDADKIIEGLENKDYNVVIATRSELVRRRSLERDGYRIEPGREFDTEFFLAGFVKKPISKNASTLLSRIEKPKIAHADDTSLFHFYRDIIIECIYRNKDEAVRPVQLYEKKELENRIQEMDIFILKVMKMIFNHFKVVGEGLLYEAKNHRANATYPVRYYDKGKEEDIVKNCVEGKKRSSKPFSNYSAREYQAPPTEIEDIYGGTYFVQGIKKVDSIVIVYRKDRSKEFKRVFWDVLYAELNQVANLSREEARQPDQVSFPRYQRALILLTKGLRGIISVANVEFEIAMEDYTVLDEVHGVGRIRKKLKNNKPLSKPEVLQINTVLDRFKEYHKKRSNLTRKKVDFNLLTARLRVINLTNLLYKHSNSQEYLSGAKNELNKLSEEIKIVETSPDFEEYDKMRGMERFDNIIDDHKDLLKEIGRLK